MKESDYKRSKQGCCSKRTRLEKILIIAIIALLIISIVLIILVAKKQADFVATNCSTQVCINEAARVAKFVDSAVNPCDNFHSFACGNYIKEVHGDEKFGLTVLLQEQAKRELLEAYMEPVASTDHKMVKVAKKLFAACMNESEIEVDRLGTIKSALKSVGGWPVIEGANWKEENFDWLKVTFKLRKLGYDYKIFLDLSVTSDPNNSTRNILKVATPDMWDFNTHSIDKIQLMTDIAEKFGATNKEETRKELSEAHEFLIQLQREVHNRYGAQPPSKYAIEVYQQRCRSLNWLEFINNIAGPTTQLSRGDLAIFPSPESMTNWLKVISLVPKRTQANYMMWKVIESSLPYLTDDLKNRNVGRSRNVQARETFCLDEIQKRFTPSPLEVACLRKYLPMEKKKQVEELITNIKQEFVGNMENVEWMDQNDKQKVIKRIEAIKIIIGVPDDYFEEKILDDLDADLITPKNDSLLNLIAQANRNHQTLLYTSVTKISNGNLNDKWYIKNAGGLPVYAEDDDVIFIPAISTQEGLYHQNRSNYLNYGALGTQIASQFANILTAPIRGYASNIQWSNSTKAGSKEKVECMKSEMEASELDNEQFVIGFIFQQSVGEKISYEAYKKWVKNHAEEKQLIGLDYTPNQLFWISAVSPFCQPVNPYNAIRRPFKDQKFFSNIISGSINNIPEFAKDFKCSAKKRSCELI